MSNGENKKTTQAMAAQQTSGAKLLLILGLVVGAFLLSYNFANAKTVDSAPAGFGGVVAGGGCGTSGGVGAGGGCGTSGGGGAGGGCCGGGGGGAPVEGATTVEADVQRIAVDTSTGNFGPNVIKAKAGVPIEIDFSQAPGGCLAGVYFPDFNINEDLTTGPKTVNLPALEKGEYTFFCQMQMISAKIVVE